MQDSPLISVIVPVYKVEDYLKKCVRSIQSQTYSNLEIILVDDGSPDYCGKICDRLSSQDSRVRTIHQANGGLSAARNSGLSVAKGKYIGFVDSDDYIDNDMFECLYSTITEYDADLAVCGARSVAEDGRILKAHGNAGITVHRGNEAYDQIIPKMNNSAWNKLYRRDLLEDIRFPVGRIHGEDFIFLLHYLKRVQTIAIVHADKYNYLQRQNSITRGKFKASKFNEISSKDEILQCIQQDYPQYIRQAQRWCFTARMNVLRSIVESGQTQEWKNEIDSCFAYMQNERKSIRRVLTKKERIESFIIVKCYSIYPCYIHLRKFIKSR